MINAKVSQSGAVTEGAVVTVTCLKKKPKRYVLIGNKDVTCQSTGWSDIPKCMKCGKFQFESVLPLTFLVKLYNNFVLRQLKY